MFNWFLHWIFMTLSLKTFSFGLNACHIFITKNYVCTSITDEETLQLESSFKYCAWWNCFRELSDNSWISWVSDTSSIKTSMERCLIPSNISIELYTMFITDAYPYHYEIFFVWRKIVCIAVGLYEVYSRPIELLIYIYIYIYIYFIWQYLFISRFIPEIMFIPYGLKATTNYMHKH